MPWKAFKVENEFCVFRIDKQGSRFGKTLGCHPTRNKANKQVAALNIAEPQKEMIDKADIRKPEVTPLGTFIRKVRIARGMSTSDLEKKMTVDESTIAKVETGVIKTPGRPMLVQFAKALGVPLKTLLGKLPKDKQPAARIAPGGRPVGKEIEIKATKIGSFIRKRRKELNLSIVDVEKRMPIDDTTIGDIERGEIETPSKPVLTAFAKVLKVSESQLHNLLPSNANPGDKVHKELPIIGEPDMEEKSVEEKFMNAVPSTRTFGATSFEDVEKAHEAEEKAHEVRTLANMVPELTRNINFAPADERAGLFTKLTDEFKARMNAMFNKSSHLDDNEHETKDIPPAQLPSFLVFKEGDTYKFITSYSNNIRDIDNPPEIIASKSHERFEKLVDKGIVPLPEVWLWHTPDWRIGKTDVITYDKENGIAIAVGHFFKEANDIAEAIYQNQEHWGVSHGMPSDSIVRNKEDRTIIEQHITKEISPLPLYAAANKWADFTILKEKIMTISQEKKDKLEEFGVDKNMLSNIESRNQKISKDADELNLERKEETPEETPTEVPVDEKKENANDSTDQEKDQEAISPAFSKEQVAQLSDLVKAMTTNITATVLGEVNKQLAPIVEQLSTERKTIDEEVKEHIRLTPQPLSLQALIYGDNVAKESATNAPETKVDGRTTLGKDGPAETKDDSEEIIMKSGNTFADTMINRIVNDTTRKELEEAAA